MSEDNTHLPISRRSIMGGAAGLGITGWVTDPAAADDFGGGNGDGGDDPPGDDSNDDGTTTVTLITGQTIHVEPGDDRDRYTVEGGEGSYEMYEDDGDTYIVPTNVDLSVFSEALFNVDLLIEQGLTDADTDVTPVIISMTTDVADEPGVSTMAHGGFSHRRNLDTIDALAGDIPKDRDGPSLQTITDTDIVDQLATSPAIDRVHLDARAQALLDDATPAVHVGTARQQVGVDGSGVTIAVLDTGIDADHPDFEDRVIDQQDFSGDGTGDNAGHGTHVAGIAAGAGIENSDLIGMAPGASLMSVKVLNDNGNGAYSDIIAGIEYAVENGADIMNMSFGGPPQPNDPLAQAVNAAASEDDVMSAVAAGNAFFHDFGNLDTPGIAEDATTVAATSADNGIAYFSKKGPSPFEQNLKPEIAAPGANINAPGSEDAGEFPYTQKGGTSMATPIIAGIAALVIESGTAGTPESIEDVLVAAADPVADESIFSAGSGEVNAEDALTGALQVHNSVLDYGLLEEDQQHTQTVTLENTGSDPLEVSVTSALRNLQFLGDSGEDISDQLTVSTSSVTIDPGTTESIDVTLAAGDAFGYNSGSLTFETDTGETARSIVGFVRGIEVTVTKLPHPQSDGLAGDSFFAYAHDGAFSHFNLAAFTDEGEYSFVALDDGGKYSFWTGGQLAPTEGQLDEGDPTWTIKEVEIGTDNASFTLDEGTVLPRPLDTSQVSEHAPFEMRRFDANVYVNYEDGPAVLANRGFIGPFNIDTAHYSPVQETDPTNIGNFYLFASEDPADAVFDTDTVFHFFDGALEYTASEPVVVDSDTFAKEEFVYHRTVPDQYWELGPAAFPSDLVNFPTAFLISFQGDIGSDRVEQTWYRNNQTGYDDSWGDEGPGFFGRYQLRRSETVFNGDFFSPEPGRTYNQTFNRDPLTDILTTWSLADNELAIRGQWYADNSESPLVLFQYSFANPNSWTVEVDGSEVASGNPYYWDFPETTIEDITPGSEIDVSLQGNVLAPTSRETTTESNWHVTYLPGTANTPPQIDSIDVRGLGVDNELPAGQSIAFVDVDAWTEDLASFRVWYAPTGVGSTPFVDASGWEEAVPLYVGDGLYGVLLDTAGDTGTIDIAVEAVDTDGNYVKKSTATALTLTDGAAHGVGTTLETNNVNTRSSRSIPVTITTNGGLNSRQIDVDSLRFGAPRTVLSGGGSSPTRTTIQGTNGLIAHFPVDGTDLPCGGPVAVQLAGELTDGTQLSGAAVLDKVVCPGDN